MKNPFAFLFARSTAAAGLNAPLTSVNLPMPPIKPPRPAWVSMWEQLTTLHPIGAETTWMGIKMRVAGIEAWHGGYYPRGLPHLPESVAGYYMEYVDGNGVIRDYFMPAKVAIIHFASQ